MVIVDDHLGLLAIAGASPSLDADGPAATTFGFHLRLARATADRSRSGTLSRRLVDPAAAISRVLHPPPNRLLVLDPRDSIDEIVGVATRHAANLLLAELAGAARRHRAAVRVTEANAGRTWSAVMAAEGVDFATIAV